MTEVRGSDRKRVREVEIGDSANVVTVCLWGEHSQFNLCTGEELVIGPLVVGVDKRSKMKRLNSVSSTSMEVCPSFIDIIISFVYNNDSNCST